MKKESTTSSAIAAEQPRTAEGNKARTNLRLLTTTAVLAALITVFTAYIFHIPYGANGGYIHFGDALIYIGAALLPTPYACLAGAIGGGLADLLTSPAWAPATIVIKMLIVLPFTSKKPKLLCKRNILAPILAFFISGTGYFLAEALFFGTAPALIASYAGSFIQSMGSAVVFWVLSAVLDRLHFKSRFLADTQSGNR